MNNRYILTFKDPMEVQIAITAKDQQEAQLYTEYYLRGLLDDNQRLARGMVMRFHKPMTSVTEQYEYDIEQLAF